MPRPHNPSYLDIPFPVRDNLLVGISKESLHLSEIHF